MGEGLIKKIEKINEIAVNVFSPPDNKLMLDSFLPGGLANISNPVCRGSSDLTNSNFASPPLNNFLNKSEKFLLTFSNAASNLFLHSELILGEFSKNIQNEEYQMKKISRKSIYLNRSVLKFDIVSEDDFILQRPGLGINPLDINEILGKRYLRQLNKGELLNSKDIV